MSQYGQSQFDDEPLLDLTLNEIIENRADQLGDDIAIHYGDGNQNVSYRELDRVANAVGTGLREMGIEKGDRVSVLFRDHLQTLFAMFGIHKAGAVYSPINFEYKGDALSYQLNDTNPDVLFVEDQYVERVNDVADDLAERPRLVVYETGADSEDPEGFEASPFAGLREAEASKPDVDVNWDDDLSVIYTSGTTGMPKGVVVSHRYPQAQFTSYYDQFLTRDDVVHCVVPLYHVGGVYQLVMSSLVAGARVVVWNRASVTDFWDRIETHGATFAGTPGPLIAWLMNQPEQDDDHETTLNKIALQPLPEQYEAVGNRYGFEFMFVGLGQTETGYSVAGIVEATDDAHGTPDDLRGGLAPQEIREQAETLGFPVVDEIPAEGYFGQPWRDETVDVTVLNDHDERVAPGEVGELAIRPQQPEVIMKRYLGKPEKTVDAWSNLWFHTGDAVYRDEEGNLFFVDRIDDVIRRRGENISSIQLQDIVNKHDAVSRTAAFPVDAEYGQEDEVAIAVEPLEDAELTEADLEPFLEEELPEFMQPKHVLFLDHLPTTKTGKLEKYKLRDRVD